MDSKYLHNSQLKSSRLPILINTTVQIIKSDTLAIV